MGLPATENSARAVRLRGKILVCVGSAFSFVAGSGGWNAAPSGLRALGRFDGLDSANFRPRFPEAFGREADFCLFAIRFLPTLYRSSGACLRRCMNPRTRRVTGLPTPLPAAETFKSFIRASY